MSTCTPIILKCSQEQPEEALLQKACVCCCFWKTETRWSCLNSVFTHTKKKPGAARKSQVCLVKVSSLSSGICLLAGSVYFTVCVLRSSLPPPVIYSKLWPAWTAPGKSCYLKRCSDSWKDSLSCNGSGVAAWAAAPNWARSVCVCVSLGGWDPQMIGVQNNHLCSNLGHIGPKSTEAAHRAPCPQNNNKCLARSGYDTVDGIN